MLPFQFCSIFLLLDFDVKQRFFSIQEKIEGFFWLTFSNEQHLHIRCLILCLIKVTKEVWILNENWIWACVFKRHCRGPGGDKKIYGCGKKL